MCRTTMTHAHAHNTLSQKSYANYRDMRCPARLVLVKPASKGAGATEKQLAKIFQYFYHFSWHYWMKILLILSLYMFIQLYTQSICTCILKLKMVVSQTYQRDINWCWFVDVLACFNQQTGADMAPLGPIGPHWAPLGPIGPHWSSGQASARRVGRW